MASKEHRIRGFLILAFVGFPILALVGLSCAPGDDPTTSGNAATDDEQRPTAAPPPIAIPSARKDRIDTVLKHIRERTLLKDHSFWTIFHGILGMGPDDAMLLDPQTNKRIKAIDYIAEGGEVRGLEFRPTADGVEVETMPGSIIGQGHLDQFVAEMAEWDLPKDKKFKVDSRDYTFEDFIRQAKAHASLTTKPFPGPDPLELTWTIVIVSKYFGPEHRWMNNRGEKLSVEDMARYELGQPIADSPVCGGTHRLFGLTWAYYLHRQAGGKKEGVWKQVADTIADYESRAHQFQNPDGSFSTNYLNGPGNEPNSQLRLATTGHILEWLALAMTDEELRQPWVEKAADSLTQLILDNIFEPLDGGALYHAAHGLEMYRARLWGPPGSHKLPIPPPPKDP
jgi:hypothetical protein